MTYKINGTTLLAQPSEVTWIGRDILGIAANGHPIYPSLRTCQFQWDAMTVADYSQLLGFYTAQGVSGSSVVEMPKYNSTSYGFYAYTGCIIQEPSPESYFAEHLLNVVLVITGVRA